MSKVLIIGGTSYFGPHIVRRLLARGDQVTVYSRGNVRPDFWNDVAHIIGDRTDREDFESKLSGLSFDAVIDQVAFELEDVSSAVQALRGRIGKYVFTSTISTYGGPGHALAYRKPQSEGGTEWVDACIDFTRHTPIREADLDCRRYDYAYDPAVHRYAAGKRHCERYLLETTDFNHVSIRVPPVIGPTAERIWWYIQRVRDGREIVLFDGGRNLFRNMCVVDVADAIVDAMDSDRTVCGAYNIAQGEIMTPRLMLESIARVLDRELKVVPIPGDLLLREGALPWGNWAYDPFSRPEYYVMDIEKARRDFDMKWTPQDEWIKNTAEWYEEHGAKEGDSFYYEHRNIEVAIARRYGKALTELAGRGHSPGERCR